MNPQPSLSIVIPTWQEAPLIADAVEWASELADEVIVVDGGSGDRTAELAARRGARVFVSPKSRGVQLHEGAMRARGDVLLFLHADARLPPSARAPIMRALADPECVGGNFLIRFLPSSWFTRLLEPSNDIRRRVTGRYYGDSGIFIWRNWYRRLGGFQPWPLMEDYDLSARIARAGRSAYVRDPPVVASARRFQGRELRTLGLWMGLQTLFWLGVPPEQLARLYPDARSARPQDYLNAVGDRRG